MTFAKATTKIKVLIVWRVSFSSIPNAKKTNIQEIQKNLEDFWIWWKNNWGKKYPIMDFIHLWNLGDILPSPFELSFKMIWRAHKYALTDLEDHGKYIQVYIVPFYTLHHT